jgi:hypothetical protein
MTASACFCATPSLDRLHTDFLALLPRLEVYARAAFRQVRCPHRREDQVAEAVALAWRWFVRLAQRGKDAYRFSFTLATLAARAVANGRRLCGQERARDAFSSAAGRRRVFTVGSLDRHGLGVREDESMAEALRDNSQTPVPEQVSFRLDFPAWLRRRGRRDRRLVQALLRGGRTREVSRLFGLTPARVSQLRRELHADWARFTADPSEDPQVLAAQTSECRKRCLLRRSGGGCPAAR